MYSPVSRLLIVLNLLQARSSITATELAERLEVNVRSVRRYITMLQDMGIPVEAERGRYGGYKLLPGFKLPPLMWTEEEAVAITLGLRSVASLGLTTSQPGVVSALAKVERVLPLDILEHVQAIQDRVALQLDSSSEAVMPAWVIALSTASYREQSVRITYQAQKKQQTERKLDCYAVLYLQKRWYAIGYCHLRKDLRMFRLDRIVQVKECEDYFTRPDNFDALAYAVQAIADIPSRWLADVLLDTTLEQIRWAVPPTFATLEEKPNGVLLRAYDDDLEHLARFLVNLGCPFLMVKPPELLDAIQQLGEKIASMAVQVRRSSS